MVHKNTKKGVIIIGLAICLFLSWLPLSSLTCILTPWSRLSAIAGMEEGELTSSTLIFPMHCYILNGMPRGLPANWMCKWKSFKPLQGVIQIFIPANRQEIRQIQPGAISHLFPCWHSCKVLDKGTANRISESLRTNSQSFLPPALTKITFLTHEEKKKHIKGGKVVFITRLFLFHILSFSYVSRCETNSNQNVLGNLLSAI